jgi:hypothetical protein
MTSITEDNQRTVNYHTVMSATRQQNAKLEKVITEMKPVDPSVPAEGSSTMTFSIAGGEQTNM